MSRASRIQVCFVALWGLFSISKASAQINVTPPELEQVDVEEHLGSSIPLDARFKNEEGKTVQLLDYVRGQRPSLLVFVYHSCPMLCSLVLDAAVRGIQSIPWEVGKEYDVIAISIDPRDTPQSALHKRDKVVRQYNRGSAEGWHFLVGAETDIRRVTDAVGFRFRYDTRQEQYAHPAALFLLSPTGIIARYLYGIDFAPSDIRLGLLEAADGKTISTIEKLLLYCYHYDPQGKRYSLMAMNVMRVAGLLTSVLLGGLILILWIRERRSAGGSIPLLRSNESKMDIP